MAQDRHALALAEWSGLDGLECAALLNNYAVLCKYTAEFGEAEHCYRTPSLRLKHATGSTT